ncbi:S8 family peptidase [Granulicoccus phenolivorans]|uniref:S8 family peptidase n=1 Tax=Granulicoccus phenolivorans TaxID=266854 RepID=UPI0004099091|nr:S8 family serine peptidase [Granulicoccus phenolivorans]
MDDIIEFPPEPQYTGRYLLVGRPDEASATTKDLKRGAGLEVASSLDFEAQQLVPEDLAGADGVFLNEIGITVLSAAADPDAIGKAVGLSSFAEGIPGDLVGPIAEPEQYVYALDPDLDYVRGFRDAANALADRLLDGQQPALTPDAEAGPVLVRPRIPILTPAATWGLKACKVVRPMLPLVTQPYTGRGIRVAVLDTGMDLTHRDFAGRTIRTASFVPNETVDDRNSHGTHCIGTSCGPRTPKDPAVDRYGIAYEAEIWAGKVLSNAGSGQDGWILAGINWAVANGCQVLSMSLGAPVPIGSTGYPASYEAAARAALQRGCLIVAAAGNDSSNGLRPVSRPANCPSILAVAAVGENLQRAPFSNVGMYAPHGSIDIAGPGVGVLSAVPGGGYGTKSGTSMATPHVAGVAALYAQSNPTYRGAALWQALTSRAQALPNQPAAHVGAGLVQAPAVVRVYPPLNPAEQDATGDNKSTVDAGSASAATKD